MPQDVFTAADFEERPEFTADDFQEFTAKDFEVWTPDQKVSDAMGATALTAARSPQEDYERQYASLIKQGHSPLDAQRLLNNAQKGSVTPDFATSPVIPIPRAEGKPGNWFHDYLLPDAWQQDPNAAAAAAALFNLGKGVVEFGESPLGLLGMATGVGGLARPVSAAFAADIGRHTPEAAAQFGKATVDGDLQQQLEAGGNLGLTVVAPAFMGAHAAVGEKGFTAEDFRTDAMAREGANPRSGIELLPNESDLRSRPFTRADFEPETPLETPMRRETDPDQPVNLDEVPTTPPAIPEQPVTPSPPPLDLTGLQDAMRGNQLREPAAEAAPTGQPPVSKTEPAVLPELPPPTATEPVSATTGEQRPMGGEPTTPPAPAPESSPLPPGEPKSIRNLETDVRRAEMGLPPAEKTTRSPMEEVETEATWRMAENPLLASNLVKELKEKPRSIDKFEQEILRKTQNAQESEFYRLADEINKAADKGDTATVTELERQLKQASDSNTDILDVIRRSGGREVAQSLAQRAYLAGDEFSFGRMVAAKRAMNGGRQLTASETAQIKQQHDALVANAKAQAQRARERESMGDEPAHTPEVLKMAERIVEGLRKRQEDAHNRLSKLLSKMGSSPDPTVLPGVVRALVEIGAYHITRIGLDKAKWLVEMSKDLAKDWEKVKPYMDEVWAKAKRDFDKVTDGAGKDKPALRRVLTEGDKVKELEREAAQLRARIKEQETALETGDVAPKSRPAPTTNLELRKRRDDLNRQIAAARRKPDSQREVEALQRKLEAMQTEITERESRIASGDVGIPERRSNRPLTESESAARTRLDDLNRQIREIRNPKQTESEARQEVETDLQERIDEVVRQINEGDIAPRPRAGSPAAASTTALREELRELNAVKQQLRNAAKPRPTPEERRISQYKTRVAARIAERLDRIARGDYSPTPKRPPLDISKDPVAMRLKAEEKRIIDEYEAGLERDRVKRMTGWQRTGRNIVEASNIYRNYKTAFDFSAVLLQGGVLGAANPMVAARAFKPMFEAFSNPERARIIEQEILNRPNARNGIYDKAGLYIAPLEGRNALLEESTMSQWANKIPGLRGSNAAYTTFLNKLRSESFDLMLEDFVSREGRAPTEIEMKAIANFINVATGRGNFGRFETAAAPLAHLIFSPRNTLSRFQLIAMQPLWGGSMATRKLIAGKMARSLATIGVVYALSKLAGAQVETDTNSSDFGKIKIGNTRIGLSAGLAAQLVFLSRLITGKTKTLSGVTHPTKLGETISNYARNKAAPIPGYAMDAYELAHDQKPPPGHAQSAGEMAVEAGLPMSATTLFSDIRRVMIEQGVPTALVSELLNLLGAQVQNYEK